MNNVCHQQSARFGTPWRRLLARFGADQSGHGAVLFGMALLPVAATVGTSIDYRDMLRANQALGTALEKVADDLFENRRIRPQPEARARAERIFQTALHHRPDLATLGLTLRQTPQAIDVSTSGKIQTRFLSAIGIQHLSISAYAVVRPKPRHIDVLLAYDTADAAALEPVLTTISIKTPSSTVAQGARIRVGLVPYTDVIRVEPDLFRNHSWLAFKETAAIDNPGHPTAFLSPRNRWQGCIGARDAEFAGQLKRTERARTTSFHPAVECADRNMPKILSLADGWRPIPAAPSPNSAARRRSQACADPTLALRFALSTLSRSDVLGADSKYYASAHPDREVHVILALPHPSAACPSARHEQAFASLCRDTDRRFAKDGKSNVRITFISPTAGADLVMTCQSDQRRLAIEGTTGAERIASVFEDIFYGTDGKLPAALP